MATRIIDYILKRVEILMNNPQAGPVEPLLAEYQGDYRYLVEGNYKIVYLLNKSHVAILAVFDCRQNPEKMRI